MLAEPIGALTLRQCSMHRRFKFQVLLAVGMQAVMYAQAAGQSNVNQFGGQARADAARSLIVLGVEQGISSLPPTSGQSLTYHLDEAGNWTPVGQIGPTAFRSPLVIGQNRLSASLAASYFSLSETFDPINDLRQPITGPNEGSLYRFGLVADAKVGIINASVSYGLTAAVELTLNIPVTIVSAHVDQISSTLYSERNLPSNEALLGGVGPVPLEPNQSLAIQALNRAFNRALVPPNGPCDPSPDPGRCLTYRKDPVTALGFDFNEGTHAGVGRIDLAAKWAAIDTAHLQAAI